MKVTATQRRELEAIVGRRSESAGLVRRPRVILLSADEVSGRDIALGELSETLAAAFAPLTVSGVLVQTCVEIRAGAPG